MIVIDYERKTRLLALSGSGRGGFIRPLHPHSSAASAFAAVADASGYRMMDHTLITRLRRGWWIIRARSLRNRDPSSRSAPLASSCRQVSVIRVAVEKKFTEGVPRNFLSPLGDGPIPGRRDLTTGALGPRTKLRVPSPRPLCRGDNRYGHLSALQHLFAPGIVGSAGASHLPRSSLAADRSLSKREILRRYRAILSPPYARKIRSRNLQKPHAHEMPVLAQGRDIKV